MRVQAKDVREGLLQALFVALAWVGLYWLNEWLFERVVVSQYIAWVFLPAALRMLAVLLTGWVGVLGLFIGSFITGLHGLGQGALGQVIGLAGVSALAPMLALLMVSRGFRLAPTLQGFSASQLLILSLLCAGLTAGIHSIHFVLSGVVPTFLEAFVPMFVGDLIGTLLMLYLAKLLVHLLGSTTRTAT
jgi:hypothetical protein